MWTCAWHRSRSTCDLVVCDAGGGITATLGSPNLGFSTGMQPGMQPGTHKPGLPVVSIHAAQQQQPQLQPQPGQPSFPGQQAPPPSRYIVPVDQGSAVPGTSPVQSSLLLHTHSPPHLRSWCPSNSSSWTFLNTCNGRQICVHVHVSRLGACRRASWAGLSQQEARCPGRWARHSGPPGSRTTPFSPQCPAALPCQARLCRSGCQLSKDRGHYSSRSSGLSQSCRRPCERWSVLPFSIHATVIGST
jgi:hypothetical protein